MARNIKVKIAETEYSLVAKDTDMERNIRTAAEDISRMLLEIDAKFPDRSQTEKMAFVALNQAVSRLRMKDRLSEAAGEIDSLTNETAAYLDQVK